MNSYSVFNAHKKKQQMKIAVLISQASMSSIASRHRLICCDSQFLFPLKETDARKVLNYSTRASCSLFTFFAIQIQVVEKLRASVYVNFTYQLLISPNHHLNKSQTLTSELSKHGSSQQVFLSIWDLIIKLNFEQWLFNCRHFFPLINSEKKSF